MGWDDMDPKPSSGGTDFQNALSQIRTKRDDNSNTLVNMRKQTGYTSQVTPGNWNYKDEL